MSRGQDSGYLVNNRMAFVQFQPLPGENILYRAIPNKKWYVTTWKSVSGIACIALFTFVLFALLGNPTQNTIASFLPGWLAGQLTKYLYLVLVPLIGALWVSEGIITVFNGEFILTDQRIWVRGSPYAWNQSDTRLEDILSMTWRRDAIFIRQKSKRGIQVHMFAEGKQIVKAYEQLTKKIHEL